MQKVNWIFGFACICESCACRAREDQKRASEPLGLELQMVVNGVCTLGTEPGSYGKALSHLTTGPSLQPLALYFIYFFLIKLKMDHSYKHEM